MIPGRSVVRGWRALEAEQIVAAQLDSLARAVDQHSGQVHRRCAELDGNGWSGATYTAAYDFTDRMHRSNRDLCYLLDKTKQQAANALSDLHYTAKTLLDEAGEAEIHGVAVAEDWSLTGPRDRVLHWKPLIDDRVQNLHTKIGAATTTIAEAARTIRDHATRHSTEFAAVDHHTQTPADPQTQAAGADRNDKARQDASSDAFYKVTGRYPESDTDWVTAEALNPYSYDPKYKGTKPVIKVARIEKVPGQGVVRTAHYIEQGQVFNVPDHDLGDNRSTDPHFDPEHSRVTSYVDYENGLVLIRQNPSVDTDGEVKVGTPKLDVWQQRDGSVRLQYDAKNPFAPGFDKDHTVNGDLVVSPGHPGATINGTRTNYPSLEAYQDIPGAGTHTIVQNPATTGSPYGPLQQLPFHHDLGSGPAAFEPFKVDGYANHGGPDDFRWGRVDHRPTPAGSVDNIPDVPVIGK